MSTRINFHKQTDGQSGNAKVIILVVLAIVAVAALAFLSTNLMKANKAASTPAAAGETAAAGEAPAATPEAAAAAAEQVEIEPGDPVVATLDGEEIKRSEVFAMIQQLPPQMRQLPVDQLFALAQDQAINTRVVQKKTDGVNLDNDPIVQKELALAKDQIVRNVYVQKQIDAFITEENLKKAYDQYVANFPSVEEVKASHILVADEAKAKDLIKQLEGGADFAQLAKDNSTDGTAANGGSLGAFAKNEVVPEFADAAFKTDPGAYTKDPVKTQFGYHIIKVETKEMRKPADYETAKPFLEAQLRQVALNDIIQKWRGEAKVERLDINGKPVVAASAPTPEAAAPVEAPAAGEPAPAPEAAPAQ